MGITLLHFRIDGKTPREKEWLNSSAYWFDRSLLNNFTISVEIYY